MQHGFGLDLPFDNGGAPDALHALTDYVRLSTGADMAIAFEADAAGLATALAATRPIAAQQFMLGPTPVEAVDWTSGALPALSPATSLRLPAPLIMALGGPAHYFQFIPTPVSDAPRSGILLLWTDQGEGSAALSVRAQGENNVQMLRQTFTQLLTHRREAMQRQLMSERFHDLFESVPSGIIVIGGDCANALINEPASYVLGIKAGEVPASHLTAPMRALRQSCVNADVLQTVYGAAIADVNYAIITLWDLGERQYMVDTHPLLGDGRKGRIWIFNDVTAQHGLELELRGLASTDPLTGMANRRQFNETGGAVLRQTRADALQMSVLMLDIDYFKAINDRYGHHVGDVVLQTFAQRCHSKLREQDLLARLGGEEFAVLLPGTSADEAAMMAERLRAAIAVAPIMADDQQIPVTVSIGGATRNAEDQALGELLACADQALYAAKNAGRNRVIFSGVEV